MSRVRLDLNNPELQQQLFGLEKKDQLAVLRGLKKISPMQWDQIHRDHGLKWEAIVSATAPHGGKLYTFRLSGKFRVLAYRENDCLRLLALHPDHDSAYK